MDTFLLWLAEAIRKGTRLGHLFVLAGMITFILVVIGATKHNSKPDEYQQQWQESMEAEFDRLAAERFLRDRTNARN